MDNPEKLATLGTVHKTKKNKAKTQHNKHKKRRYNLYQRPHNLNPFRKG